MASSLKSVELSTGVSLPYIEQGDPAGLPVLLLHGLSDSHRSLELLLPHLPASIRALALTQRGHGDADHPATGYRMPDFAADAAAFLDALGIEAAVIAGHSMGSSVAQCLALDYPERVLGLVLMGSFVSFHDNPVVVEFWEMGISPLVDPIDPSFAREFQQATLAQPVPPAFLDMIVAESLKVPARVWRAVVAGFLEIDRAARLGEIAAPTLIVWGDQDVFAPRSDQDRLATAIAGSRLLVYAGAGHAFHWEEPERFAADLVAFTKTLAGDGARTLAVR